MTVPLSPRLLAALACPVCGGTLSRSPDGSLACGSCPASYPVREGVPVLLLPGKEEEFGRVLEEEGKGMAREYRAPRWRSLLARLRPPSLLLPLEPDLAGRETDLVFHGPDGPLLTVAVGGGPTRHRDEANLNIAPFPNVDLVGDAHRLPFSDGSLDSVICKAVLEHVADPGRVMDEIRRVLRPGGVLYLDVPFLFIAHAYPMDFARFTSMGVARLAQGFEVVRLGASIGPFSTLLLLANDFLLEVTGLRGGKAGKLLSGAFRLVFFPLKYLDLFFRGRTPDFAGAYHLIGRRMP